MEDLLTETVAKDVSGREEITRQTNRDKKKSVDTNILKKV